MQVGRDQMAGCCCAAWPGCTHGLVWLLRALRVLASPMYSQPCPNLTRRTRTRPHTRARVRVRPRMPTHTCAHTLIPPQPPTPPLRSQNFLPICRCPTGTCTPATSKTANAYCVGGVSVALAPTLCCTAKHGSAHAGEVDTHVCFQNIATTFEGIKARLLCPVAGADGRSHLPRFLHSPDRQELQQLQHGFLGAAGLQTRHGLPAWPRGPVAGGASNPAPACCLGVVCQASNMP